MRGPFIVLCSTIWMIGYIIVDTTSQPGPGYAAVVIAFSGGFPCVALFLTWAGSNAGGNTKRGVVLGIVIGLGNLGGCVFHLGPKLCVDAAAHKSNVTPQDLCFIYLLSTSTFSHGSRHSTRLHWYEVCTDTSSRGRNRSFSSRDG
jgi:hypothetical protein